jgi:hypothetical protein
MARWLEGNIGKYSGGGLQRFEGDELGVAGFISVTLVYFEIRITGMPSS